MRLKFIEHVDFRKSELTNYQAMQKLVSSKKVHALRAGEVACFVSGRGDQIIFVYPMDSVSEEDGTERRVLRSEKLRLAAGGSWNPMMLGNYAMEAGIELEGIRLFESHYKDVLVQRREERRLKRLETSVNASLTNGASKKAAKKTKRSKRPSKHSLAPQ
jgi:hypothetical protein